MVILYGCILFYLVCHNIHFCPAPINLVKSSFALATDTANRLCMTHARLHIDGEKLPGYSSACALSLSLLTMRPIHPYGPKHSQSTSANTA